MSVTCSTTWGGLLSLLVAMLWMNHTTPPINTRASAITPTWAARFRRTATSPRDHTASSDRDNIPVNFEEPQ